MFYILKTFEWEVCFVLTLFTLYVVLKNKTTAPYW